MTTAANQAEAQARQAVAISGTPAALHNAARPIEDDRSSRRDKTPMGRTSVGLNVGMAGMGVGRYTLQTDDGAFNGSIDARRGLFLSLPIHVGGDGFGWTFAPFMARSSMVNATKDGAGNVTGHEDVTLSAYGLYTGPVYHFHVMQPLYLGVGVGLKTAYVVNDAFKYAADAYARIPLSATYYLSDQLAVVAETGFGYGVSAFVPAKMNVVGGNDAARSGSFDADDLKNTESDPRFGKAFAWDFAVGIRLP